MLKTFNASQTSRSERLASLRSHLVERVLLSASRGRTLSARETEVLSGIIERHSDKPLKLVSDYVKKSVRFGLVARTEELFGRMGSESWDLDFLRVLEIVREAPAPLDDSARVPVGPNARVSVSHEDQNAILCPVDPDTLEPVDDYVEGDCGTFKIIQDSGSHAREAYERIFGSKRS